MKYEFKEKEHLHLLDGKPLTGTSSVGSVLHIPLAWWASGLACEIFGWINPKYNSSDKVNSSAEKGLNLIKGLSLDKYKTLLTKAYRHHHDSLNKSAKKGTDLHAELERYVKNTMHNRMSTPVYNDRILPFIEWAEKNVKKFLWSEAHCYDEELWVGGISDCGVELNDGKMAIIDFKSSKDAYPTHYIQCAGYAIQIENNGLWSEDGSKNKKVAKKFDALIIVPFGAKVVEPKMLYNIDSYKEGFRNAVGLYRLLKNNK
jgi:hypothetical protein